MGRDPATRAAGLRSDLVTSGYSLAFGHWADYETGDIHTERPLPMSETPSQPASLARFGSLLGDPLRASILVHLGDGARRPATELAFLAGASPQALSAHLRQLTDGGLLAVERQGRYRLY